MNKLNKNQLIDKCKNLGIRGYSSKKKDELVELINSFNSINIQNDDTKQNSNNLHLSPLIKWSGGKSDEIKEILKYIPSNYNKYIEPFVGGAALYWYLCPSNAVINDVHNELIAFYKSIKDGNILKIKEFMDNNKNDEDTYYRIRDTYETSNDLDVAQRFYYIRKTCFRGMMRYNSNGKFNIPFGKYDNINYNDLDNHCYEDVLKNTDIYNVSYDKIFELYNDENNFVFLDPPYDSKFTDYGYCSFDREEHKKLANLFKNTKNKCLMIIGKTDFISELYNGYIKAEYKKKYRFKLHSGRIGDEINTTHLVITNY
jgi:DNA adenine methylase